MKTPYNASMTNAELVTVYNSFVDEDHQIKCWKKSKDELLERLDNLPTVRVTPKASLFDVHAEELADMAASVDTAEAVDVKLTKTQAAIRKVRKMSKSMKLLDLLLDVEDNSVELNYAVSYLETSEGSVRSYVSYFRSGKKGHPVVELTVDDGIIMFANSAAKKAATKVMDNLRSRIAQSV